MAVPNILPPYVVDCCATYLLKEDGRSRWYDDYLRGSSQYTILWTSATRVTPSVPGYTAVMTPRGQIASGSRTYLLAVERRATARLFKSDSLKVRLAQEQPQNRQEENDLALMIQFLEPRKLVPLSDQISVGSRVERSSFQSHDCGTRL
ncbi:hypothetical protein EVAR_90651_1 [Eumeta japonica]|uniref:Uncharacterized protein n=1 Tax=Eumeta variegata TaxID=151549 RepID=A0A4C1ZC08_EUMVA|nr:hypothetical protein EVAR_90651_1 [Eumeta japonica]